MRKFTALDVACALIFLVALGSYVSQRYQIPAQIAARWTSQQRVKTARHYWGRIDSASFKPFAPGFSAQLVEITDYECVACRNMQATLDTLHHSGLRVGYLLLPRDDSPSAIWAAAAAVCSDAQGAGAAVHRLLMKTTAWRKDLSPALLAFHARIADSVAFAHCIVSPATAQTLATHKSIASRLYVRRTPTFVSPEGTAIGTVTSEQLRQLADTTRGR